MSGWVRRRFGAYGRACLLAGVFLAPLAVHLRSAAPFASPKFTVLCLSTAGALAAWVAWSVERRVWLPRSRLVLIALGFLGAAALSTAASLSPLRSLVGDHDRRAGLVSLALLVGLFVAIVGLFWETPTRLRALTVAASAATAGVAASVLLQIAGLDRVLWAGPVPGGGRQNYPPGTLGHPMFAGAYLGMTAPLLAYATLAATSRVARCALGAVGAVVLVALWETQSRSGMVALVVGATVMAFAARDRWPRWSAGVAALGVAVALVPLALVVWHPGSEQPPDRLAGLEVLQTRSLQYRLSVWAAAGRAVLDRPVLGSGPDTFYATFSRYRSPDPRWDGLAEDKAHNIFLERATETGLVAAGAYIVLVALALHYGYRHARASDPPERLLTAAFLGVLAGYLAQGMFSIDRTELATVGWVALGALVALADPSVRARRARVPFQAVAAPAAGSGARLPGPRQALHLLVAAALIVVVVAGLRPLRADVAAATGRPDEAVRLNPLDPENHVRVATLTQLVGQASLDGAQKEGLLSTAKSGYLQALRLKPKDINYLVALARLETAWAEDLDPTHFEAAARWWAEVGEQDPTNRRSRELGRAELSDAKLRTVTRLEAVARLRFDDAPSWAGLAAAYRAVGDSAGEQEALAHQRRTSAVVTAPEAGQHER